MADSKITALTALTAADPANDMIPIVDVSDTPPASGNTKRISINNILACSPTATLASATITGDLTVDTSTLYVSSSADKVAIGTTSLSNEKLTVAGNISANAWLGRSNIAAPAGDCSIFRSADNTLGFGIASSTAMTLNSTGLGVGVVPSAGKFEVQESGTGSGIGGIFTSTVSGGGNPGVVFRTASTNRWSLSLTGSAGAESIRFYDINNSATRLLIDTSGNVGIGVTPSATNSTYFQALEIARVGQGLTAAKNVLTGSPSSWLSNNSYATYSSGVVWNYAVSQPAAQYRLFEGQHLWYTAPSGTAGNAITFTERLRLKETGQLRFVPLAADPSGAEAGDVYYNSTSNKLKCYNGTTWNDLF